MLRRTNVQRDNGRTLNIEDEIEVQAAKEREVREIEESKDMTFDDFMAQFEAHINGTAANEREAIDSADEDDKVPKSAKPGASSLSKKDPNKTASSHAVDDVDDS